MISRVQICLPFKGKSGGTLKSGANSSKSSGKKKKEISTGIGRFPVPKKYYLYFLFVNK